MIFLLRVYTYTLIPCVYIHTLSFHVFTVIIVCIIMNLLMSCLYISRFCTSERTIVKLHTLFVIEQTILRIHLRHTKVHNYPQYNSVRHFRNQTII